MIPFSSSRKRVNIGKHTIRYTKKMSFNCWTNKRFVIIMERLFAKPKYFYKSIFDHWTPQNELFLDWKI